MTRWILIVLAHSIDLIGGSTVKLGRSVRQASARWSGFTSEILHSGLHRVHYWEGGSGAPVILIHGFGAGGLPTWLPVARGLAKTYRVIIPDLLWFGDSTSTAAPSLDTQAAAIQALVEHLVSPGERVDVVGSSYGGFVALRYGAIEPTRQGKLAILGSPGPFFGLDDRLALLERFEVETPEQIFVPQEPKDVRRLIELAFHTPPPLPSPLLRDLFMNVFSSYREERTTLLQELEREHQRYQAMKLAPYSAALVIWGKHDRVFPAASGEDLAAHLGGEYREIEDTAHAPQLERPAPVTHMLREFLKA